MNDPKILKRVERAHGRPINTFLGSPHEGDPEDKAEIVLHEMAHAQLLGLPLAYGKSGTWHLNVDVETTLKHWPKWRADLNEVRTVAVELLVAERLGLTLRTAAIRDSGRKNSQLHFSPLKFNHAVHRAKNTAKCQRAADALVTLIQPKTRRENSRG